MTEETIVHSGVVERIDGCHLLVKIWQKSACAGCKAHSLCNSSESKEHLIDVCDEQAAGYAVGEAVELVGSLSMGRRAVRLAFVWPLLLLLATVLAANYAAGSELAAATAGLLVLVPYYFILYKSRRRWAKELHFKIKKQIKD